MGNIGSHVDTTSGSPRHQAKPPRTMEVRRPLPGSLGREPTYLWGSGDKGISHQLYEQRHGASCAAWRNGVGAVHAKRECTHVAESAPKGRFSGSPVGWPGIVPRGRELHSGIRRPQPGAAHPSSNQL